MKTYISEQLFTFESTSLKKKINYFHIMFLDHANKIYCNFTKISHLNLMSMN